MSARFLRRPFARGFILLALCAICPTACLETLQSPQGDLVEGRSTRPAWRKPGLARLQARHEAVLDARNKIWTSLLTDQVNITQLNWAATPTPETVSIEYLTLVNPVFESRLRAYIGSLQPLKYFDEPDGELIALLSVDRSAVLSLAAVAVTAMRTEGRISLGAANGKER